MKTLQRFSRDGIKPSASMFVKRIKKMPLPYTGNKKKLLQQIFNSITNNNIKFNTVLDAFSGSASVSLLFKSMGKQVFSNDLLTSSYLNSVAFVENDNIKLNEEEKKFLVYNDNKNKKHFVENNYLGTIDCNSRFKKFTLKECQYLDNFRANVDDLGNVYSQSIALAANAAIVLRLPFGNADQSIDILKHRKKQQENYGPNSKNKDRRIGIYYDSDLSLNFGRWFSKYVDNFDLVSYRKNREETSSKMKFLDNIQIHKSQQLSKCSSINMDILKFLENNNNQIDCVYFDPPYGGDSSDYASIYRFLEEYIYSDELENLPHIQNSYRFVNKKNYEEHFVKMLSLSNNIPIWMFSYNDSSWADINYITNILKNFKKEVIVDILDDDYRYLYRKNHGKNNKSKEYLIIAQ